MLVTSKAMTGVARGRVRRIRVQYCLEIIHTSDDERALVTLIGGSDLAWGFEKCGVQNFLEKNLF